MSLNGRILSRSMQGEDVAILHRWLRELGVTLSPDETEPRPFGSAKQEVVLTCSSEHLTRTAPRSVNREPTSTRQGSRLSTSRYRRAQHRHSLNTRCSCLRSASPCRSASDF